MNFEILGGSEFQARGKESARTRLRQNIAEQALTAVVSDTLLKEGTSETPSTSASAVPASAYAVLFAGCINREGTTQP